MRHYYAKCQDAWGCNMQVNEAAMLAWFNNDLEKISLSPCNHVYKLWLETIPNELCEKFFFKIGYMGDSKSAKLETLAWKTAIIFNYQDFFVPTTLVRLDLKQVNPLKYKNRSDKMITLQQVEVLGSLQSFEVGKKASELIASNNECLPNYVTIFTFTKAVLISLLVGMYDAHSSNIIITPDGKIKFYDNNMIFPHSSTMIRAMSDYVSAFRSGLCQFNEYFALMTDKQREWIEAEILEFKNNMPNFEKFLRDGADGLLEGFTEESFDVEQVISETKGRLNRIEKAMGNPHVRSLFDLTCRTFPHFCFSSVIMGYAYYVDAQNDFERPTFKKIRNFGGAAVGLFKLQNLVCACLSKSIDVDAVVIDSNNEKKSYECILRSLIQKNGPYSKPKNLYKYLDIYNLWVSLHMGVKPTFH